MGFSDASTNRAGSIARQGPETDTGEHKQLTARESADLSSQTVGMRPTKLPSRRIGRPCTKDHVPKHALSGTISEQPVP
ncbi:MAG TPA: hypothetical protein VFN67_42750, partial [Polyangiales bacterium]|nr:hypothetical protein [Polyangiales bacterium]